jgi:hypothetical protein
MGHIFISYCSEDRPFALQLADDLDNFYSIWIDREGITGGARWEEMIEQAIAACDLFLVVVTPYSNASNWVTRETIRAEQLKKYRVPVLLEGELPLRLLELQYVDFRGDHSGGMRDLFDIVHTQLVTDKIDIDQLDRLVGAGLRAYMEEDYPTANNLIGQVTILSPDFGKRLSDLWKLLSAGQQTAKFADKLMPDIAIREWAQISQKQSHQQGTTYEWSLELVAYDETIERIDFVKYYLHPTFENPTRIIRDRDTRFRLNSIGWGTFSVEIEIHFIDGTVGHTDHELTFDVAS